jgi:hypothetical protein
VKSPAHTHSSWTKRQGPAMKEPMEVSKNMVKRALLFVVAVLLSASLGQAETFTIPAGSTIHCRLTQTISTKLNFQGDAFTATVTEPYMMNGEQIIPVGSTITGRINDLLRPGRIRGVGEMRLSAEQISFPDGRTTQFNAVLLTAYGADGVKVDSEEGLVKGPSSRFRDIKEVGIGMGGGGFLGTVIGGVHGAVIGGAIGGAVALADTLRKRGQDLTLPTGTELSYQLTRPMLVIPPSQTVTTSRNTLTPVRPDVSRVTEESIH